MNRLGLWVATIYFAASLPNVAVSELSKFIFNDMGLSLADQTFWTGSMYLPWAIKPLWSPFVDMLKTKRWWIVVCEIAMALAFAFLALGLQTSSWLGWSLGCFCVVAFVSATHDIACDGLYILGLSETQQAGYNGLRAVAYRLAAILAKGGLVILAGSLAYRFGVAWGWSASILVLAGCMGLAAVYHWRHLPSPSLDVTVISKGWVRGYLHSFRSFLRKPGISTALAFTLLFRFAEGQMLAIVVPFLTASRDTGALGFTTEEVGYAYGTCGTVGVILGGVLAAWMVARLGLRRLFWPMIAVAHLPDLLFLWMACAQPTSLTTVGTALFVEQFGFGFGFSVYMLYLMYFARGEMQTTHFAMCTGLMAIGGMIPGMIAGRVAEALGYVHFYQYVLLCIIPGVWAAWLAWRDPNFIDAFKGET